MESRCGHLELGLSLRCASNQKMLRRQRHPLLRSRLLGTLLRQSGRLLHELMLKSPLKLLAPLNHPDIAEKRSKRPEPYRKRSRSPMHGPLLPSASLLPLPGPLQDEKQAPILRSTSELKKKQTVGNCKHIQPAKIWQQLNHSHAHIYNILLRMARPPYEHLARPPNK